MSSSTSSNRDLVLEFFRYIEEHNASALSNSMSDDFKLTMLPASLGWPVRNKEQAVELLTGLLKKIPSLCITLIEWVESEDTVAAQYAGTGTLADGSPYHAEYMGIYRFKDGKLVYMKEFVDSNPRGTN
ncbi:hypothetical protein BDQ17DRAFT_1334691 [Cyathus striatus]|nr:hypothetical protein BDQ17DRAFT_1334691 [Cyathus striatus]